MTLPRYGLLPSPTCWPYSWLFLSLNIWHTSLEAEQVIGLRLALLRAGSGPAGAEVTRMVSEKMSAALEVQHAVAVAAITGKAELIPARTLAIYRRTIRGDRHRLGAAKPPATRLARQDVKGSADVTVTGWSDGPTWIPEEIRARLARPTIRLLGPVGHPMVASFFEQLLPVLAVEGAILVELFTDGGDAEIGRRLAEEMRSLRRHHSRVI